MNEDAHINAKDYYYEYIAPEEKGTNYQSAHHAHLYKRWREQPDAAPEGFDESQVERYLNFEPEHSNDFLLNEALKIISGTVDKELADVLNSFFIAKRNIKDAHAEAAVKRGKYVGDIVFFYVGLSDACSEYALLFSKFYGLSLKIEDFERTIKDTVKLVETLEVLNLGASSQKVDLNFIRQRKDDVIKDQKTEWVTEFAVDAIRLCLSQTQWTVDGNYIQFNPLFIPNPFIDGKSATLAFFTDKFILSHEIAHHLLGHTGSSKVVSNLLETVSVACGKSTRSSELHVREFQADALALMMTAGLTVKGEFEGEHVGINRDRKALLADATIGSLLTLTVLGQAAGDMNFSTKTHPSAQQRYDNCLEIIKASPGNEVALSVEQGVRKFGQVLDIVRQSSHNHDEMFKFFGFQVPEEKDEDHLSEFVLNSVRGVSELVDRICAIIGSEG